MYLMMKRFSYIENTFFFTLRIRLLTQLTVICSKATIETLEKYVKCSGVFIVNFEHNSHLFLVFLLLTLDK